MEKQNCPAKRKGSRGKYISSNGPEMAHRTISGSRVFMTGTLNQKVTVQFPETMNQTPSQTQYGSVLYAVAACRAVAINDLLDRASQRSDTLHSLSTTLTHDLDSHFSPVSRMMMPRPSMCHTSSLQTPIDKEQALQVSESDLLSLARSLLQAWFDPLVFLSTSAKHLPHPAHNSISNKIRELQEHSKSLGDGLDILSGKLGPAAQDISLLPYDGSNDIGHDKISRLAYFHFLLSCFRRDSHKIDSFLKVLRCRAARMQPDMC